MAVEKIKASINTLQKAQPGPTLKKKLAYAFAGVAGYAFLLLFTALATWQVVYKQPQQIKNIESIQAVLPAATFNDITDIKRISVYSTPNLLQNPGFEAGSDRPPGWQYLGFSNTSNSNVSASSVHSGSLGVFFHGSYDFYTNNKNLGLYQPQAKTVNGREYTLSVWVRTNVKTNATIRLGFLGGADTRDPNYPLMTWGQWSEYAKDVYQDFSE